MPLGDWSRHPGDIVHHHVVREVGHPHHLHHPNNFHNAAPINMATQPHPHLNHGHSLDCYGAHQGYAQHPVNAVPPPPVLAPLQAEEETEQKQGARKKRKLSFSVGQIVDTSITDNKCSQCFKIFNTKGLLTQHLLVHTNVRRFPCDLCEKAFKQKAHLDTHRRIHTGDKPYKCSLPNCDKAFAQMTNLKTHMKHHENQLERKLAIEGSSSGKIEMEDEKIDVDQTEDAPGEKRKRGRPRKIQDKAEYIHWRGRGRPRNDAPDANLQDPYYSACAGVSGENITLQLIGSKEPNKTIKKDGIENQNCLVEYSSAFQAIQVKETKATTDVSCTVCCKVFRTKGLLTQHMLVHNNVRRFVCEVCEKAFKQKAHLKTHKRIHTGDKPFQCNMPNCNRQFAQATNLKLHLRSHENRLERVLGIEAGPHNLGPSPHPPHPSAAPFPQSPEEKQFPGRLLH
jgi:uncharacterized Zn-finger protein